MRWGQGGPGFVWGLGRPPRPPGGPPCPRCPGDGDWGGRRPHGAVPTCSQPLLTPGGSLGTDTNTEFPRRTLKDEGPLLLLR